jgi:hypothetical protein
MSAPTSRDLREYLKPPVVRQPPHRSETAALLNAVRIYTALTALAAAALLAIGIFGQEMHIALAGAGGLVLAAIGGAVLCVERLLADRQEFYRRGQLSGWMKGWRGEAPDVDDPLLRR